MFRTPPFFTKEEKKRFILTQHGGRRVRKSYFLSICLLKTDLNRLKDRFKAFIHGNFQLYLKKVFFYYLNFVLKESQLSGALSTSSDWCLRHSKEAAVRGQLEEEISVLKLWENKPFLKVIILDFLIISHVWSVNPEFTYFTD